MLFLALLEKEGEGSRARIMAALRGHPGMNQSQLCKAVGLSWATTKYHLGRLSAQGAVVLERRGRRDIRCFPVDIPERFRPWLATLHDADAVQVLHLLGAGEAGVAALAKALGWSQSAMRRRLERMAADRLVTKRGVLRPRYARHPDMPPWVVPGGPDGSDGPDEHAPPSGALPGQARMT